MLASDYIIAYTSLTAERQLILPAASANTGRVLIVKDESGSASDKTPIRIIGTIDGAINPQINVAYGSLTLYSNGTSYFLIAETRGTAPAPTLVGTPTVNRIPPPFKGPYTRGPAYALTRRR